MLVRMSSAFQCELESIAVDILQEAGQSDDAPPRVRALVHFYFGPDGVETMPGLRFPGALARVGDRWRIFLRPGLPPVLRAFVIVHELAEHRLRTRLRYVGADVEHAANYVAAAVLCPRRAFLHALRGAPSFEALADAFGVSETLVALREAEALGRPRAVVSPALVRVRGPESWVWPRADVIRGWTRTTTPGIRKIRLKEDRHRFVLDPEELDAA